MEQENCNEIKSARDIGVLVKKLNVINQTYVLNTINAFLYCRDIEKEERRTQDVKSKNS